jgi:signal transduction histidine kinase
MSLLRVGILIIPLLLLLTWLVARTNTEIPVSGEELQVLDDYAATESLLHRDVLAARAGMLRNYDPLVQELKAMRQAVDRLHKTTATDSQTIALTKELIDIVNEKERWTEQFKTFNSLLQNSLAYFGVFSAKLSAVDDNSDLAKQVGSLATAMLHLTLDASPAVIDDVDKRLQGVSTGSLSGNEANLVRALIAHGDMLRKMLPETNNALRHLLSLTTKRQQEALRAHIATQQSISENRARIFRYVLYVISLVLVGLLVLFGAKLQSRAMNLRWRANFEHLIATISTRFISSHPDGLATKIEQALAELALYLNADRAYFIAANGPEYVFKWSRAGADFPPDWPEKALNLSKQLKPDDDGIVHIPRIKQSFLKNELQSLVAADVQAWLCVPGLRSEVSLLGFDALTYDTDIASSKQFGLSRVAFDAITYAIEREINEHEKKRLEVDLQRARRMETVGGFASGIAHNFNNIVAAILGYTEMASAHVESGSHVSRSLVQIHRAGERARDLVDQILKFGQRVNPKRERLSVNELLTETRSLLEASLPGHIDLIVREDTAAKMIVEVDSTQLQQVLLNLCNNAAQAIDKAGTIEIAIDTCDLKSAFQIGRSELKRGRYAIISVIDTGRGMDDATCERIFEPFFTTRIEGNGLGLATVYEIVQEHGGAVKVHSRLGHGTRFDIWIPDVLDGNLKETQHSLPPMQFGNGETLLVLERDHVSLLKHEEILAALGYEPIGFTAADQAISALEASPSRFDLILICCPREVSAGLKLAQTLHQADTGLPIILTTISAEHLSAASLAAAGVSQLVTSQFSSVELANALRRSLALQSSNRASPVLMSTDKPGSCSWQWPGPLV